MKRVWRHLKILASLVRGGHASFIVEKLRRAMWSERRVVMLRRDLLQEAPPPPGPTEFSIRPAQAGDVEMLLGEPASAEDADVRALRRTWLEGGLPGCYVATVKDGSPCYMQWLLRESDDDRVRSFFGDTLPPWDADTVMLEGAYTPPRYRRIPLMPAAMARIAALGRETGARWAVVFVNEDHASMLKATQWAGFVPFRMQTERRRLFRRYMTYSDLA